jgi:ABC-type multidrug transport system fused ATPase/permease subunit
MGIGDKFGSTVQFVSAFLTGTIIAFYRGWKLTLVILSVFPLFIGIGYIFKKVSSYISSNELKSYAKAGSICEEVLSSIRTVFAFNGAPREHKRYETELEVARKFGIKKSALTGLMLGVIWLLVNSTFALSYWYGWTLTKKDPLNNCLSELTIGEIILVLFSIILAVFSLGQAAPFMEKLAEAQSAAYEIFKIIDRISKMDIESDSGIKLDDLKGDILFSDVTFNYPSRKDVIVLNEFNINIQQNTTIALVGSSGCGKSTCVQLIQRFYDPLTGQITIDGKNIQELNLSWFRSQIGVVNQEPILFDTTIANNIRFGTSQQNVTQEEIEDVAKQANAHDFIMKLPQKYETIVGSRGSQLSGGQKQRIAIARALIRNPKILLLDEATSALDNESEAIVQSALDKASKGRTTIIVAHRLTTIRNVDKIHVIDKGKVVECGTHDELMTKMGHYYGQVCLQQANQLSDKKLNEEQDSKLEFFAEKLSENNRERSISIIDTIFSSQTLTKKHSKFSMKDVLKLNKPEYVLIFFGSLFCLISGAIMPAFAIVMSKLTAVNCLFNAYPKS